MTGGRLPHSDIFGSPPVYDSPKLFAVHHVLHHRNAPRHPPYALSSLDSSCSACVRPTTIARSRSARLSVYVLRVLLSSMSKNVAVPVQCVGRAQKKLLKMNGDERDRTADVLLARQVLSQLSYAPLFNCPLSLDNIQLKCMGLPGLEPGTSRLSGVRSKPAEL
jgi:hypothetical protein